MRLSLLPVMPKVFCRRDHPLALQICYGYLGREALQRADCLIGIGTALYLHRYPKLESGTAQTVHPIDEDSTKLGLNTMRHRCGRRLETDVASTHRGRCPVKTGGARLLRNSEQRSMHSLRCQSSMNYRNVLPRDTIYAIDVHALGYASFAEFPIYDPRTFLYPNIGVALGHAYPAAIGAKVAHPDRPVICFSGDGGFLMGAVEMATAMKYGINVVAIVINDGALSSD